MKHPYGTPAVEAVFESYPRHLRVPLLQIRDLVFEVAAQTDCQNRAIVLDPTEPLPVRPLSVCIEMALTYKLRKKRRRPGQRSTAVGGGAR